MPRTVAALALAAAALALAAPAASAQSPVVPQYSGDPLTYLVANRPATSLTVLFALTQPLPAGSSATVQTAGGTVLGSVTPKPLGTSGLCYQARYALAAPVSGGGTVTFLLTAGATPLQPNPELVQVLTVRRARDAAALVGMGAC